MSRRASKSRPRRAGPPPPPLSPASAPRDAAPATRRGSPAAPALWLAAGLVLAAALAAWWLIARSGPGDPAPPAVAQAPRPAPTYVGSAACVSCHAAEHAAWLGSHHDRAMQVADERSVLGDFANTTFRHAGVTSTFFRRDGRPFVRTDGPDGRLADFEIRYTFGVEPLQQYLIEMPGGRLQALGVAWDSRPKSAGGQRWFHLYPDLAPRAGDPLHWTGIDQNWNYQCADCHSTNLRKGYDAASGSFRTTWTDLNVGCEACHGPASNHVAWAGKTGDAQALDSDKGLAVALDERRGVRWSIDAATGNAARSAPRTTNREVETCARCHARRGQFSDDWHAGRPFGDGFRAALIEPGLYHPDGQQRDEVYNHGSFLQSRMHAKGVTCSDCHDPHSARLRLPGNATCAQCHAPAVFDTEAHTHHRAGSDGARCAACHMPTTTYMVVDPRHDHSFRIPRPDRTLTLGVPNACNQCHTAQTPQWAADAVASWFPQRKPGHQTFAEALAAGDRGAPGAQAMLLRVVEDPQQPAIARASALQRLGRYPGPQTLPALRNALSDPDADVRAAAVDALAAADAGQRAQWLARLLDDPVRMVRMQAARQLAGEPESRLDTAARTSFERAFDEYLQAQRFNAERPEAQTAIGVAHALRGDSVQAEAAYRQAIALEPGFAAASINLADLLRATGREDEAERVLRDALRREARSAPLQHALGLSLVRQQRRGEALPLLQRAARLAPDDARFAYVYGVALHDSGQPAAALQVLRSALQRQPYDRDLLVALASYEREAGRLDAARAHARLLVELEPGLPGYARLAAELDAAAGIRR